MNKLEKLKIENKINFRCEAIPGKEKSKVYLYGDIVDEVPIDWWTNEPEVGDFITPKLVRETFDAIENSHVDLHINSYGGSVFASVAIHNYLVGLDKTIDVYVDGIAASGASIVAMAGDKVIMPKNTTLMIHRASSGEWGNASDMRKMAETLDKLDSTLVANYEGRFKGSSEELIALLEDETYFTADEALQYGLCDEIIEAKTKKPDEVNIENKVDKKILYNLAKLKF